MSEKTVVRQCISCRKDKPVVLEAKHGWHCKACARAHKFKGQKARKEMR